MPPKGGLAQTPLQRHVALDGWQNARRVGVDDSLFLLGPDGDQAFIIVRTDVPISLPVRLYSALF